MTELSEKLEDGVAGVMKPPGAQQVEEGGVKLTGHRKNLAHSPSVNPSLKSNLRRQTGSFEVTESLVGGLFRSVTFVYTASFT